MPGMTGDQLAHNLSLIAPSLPVVLLTGYHPKESDFLSDPIRVVLKKPCPLEELDATIRHVLDGALERRVASLRTADDLPDQADAVPSSR